MRFGILCCIALLTAACGKRAVTIDSGAGAEMASRWNGTLAAPSDMAGVVQIRGDTWMAAEGNRTITRIDIRNASPGGEHPWHVHSGRCGSNGSIVGDASAYPLLEVDGDGEARAVAHLNLPLPTWGDYYVNVHASQTNLQTIIACANLARPTR